MSKSYWLVKTEPDCFSIQDLAAAPGKTTCWDGVRNYLARNHMRAMQLGDSVLVYHSSIDPLAIVGIAEVARRAYPDHTAWDKKNDHFDAKASPENPIWEMVDLRLKEIFAEPVLLERLRAEPRLAKMELFAPRLALVGPTSDGGGIRSRRKNGAPKATSPQCKQGQTALQQNQPLNHPPRRTKCSPNHRGRWVRGAGAARRANHARPIGLARRRTGPPRCRRLVPPRRNALRPARRNHSPPNRRRSTRRRRTREFRLKRLPRPGGRSAFGRCGE